MAVNVFEELVRGAVQADRYLTTDNVPYRLHANARSIREGRWREDAVSDIDIIAYAPHRTGVDRVLAISCKGGRKALDVSRDLARLRDRNPRQTICGSNVVTGFRELTEPDWAKAFRATVHRVTGSSSFVHVLAVRQVIGDRRLWQNDPGLKAVLTPHLRLLDLRELMSMLQRPKARLFTNSSIARLAELIQAAA